MSTLALSQHIGKLGSLPLMATYPDKTLDVAVRITGCKVSYGKARYQVTPVSGTGSVWVDSSRVQIEEQKGDGQ